jgi:hypothetical protein
VDGGEGEAGDGTRHGWPTLAKVLVLTGLALNLGIVFTAIAMPVSVARVECGSALFEDSAKIDAIATGQQRVVFDPVELYGDGGEVVADGSWIVEPGKVHLGSGAAVAAQLDLKCEDARRERQTLLLLALIPGILIATAGWMVARSR